MKIIKIFLASSDELIKERKELADLVAHLNYTLNKINFNIVLVKWEYLDASMGPKRKQDEYNQELKDCEICMILYWTKFGIYTKEELDVAYNSLKVGNNPRKLYVYFKNTAQKITDELKEFRDSFPNVYGHFYCYFSNIDMLKTHFLLQFMEYQNQLLKDSGIIELKDSKIYVSGKSFVDLHNVSFAGNNNEYKLLLNSIRTTRKLMSVTEVDDPDYSEYAQELQRLLKRQKEMEESLWQTALTITRLNNSETSERLQLAIDLFNKGDNRGADAILKEEDIYKDVNHNLILLELGEEGRKGLISNINELQLKIRTLRTEISPKWGEKVCVIHDRIIELTEKAYGTTSKALADAFYDTALDYTLINNYTKALLYIEKALKIYQYLFGEKNINIAECYNIIIAIYNNQGEFSKAINLYKNISNNYIKIIDENPPIAAIFYNNMGVIYKNLKKFSDALRLYKKALLISTNIFSEYHHFFADCYNNMGNIYSIKGNFSDALKLYEKALLIRIKIFGKYHHLVADCYNNIGNNYCSMKKYSNALALYKKALDINITVFGKNHNKTASTYNNIGNVYYCQKNLSKALELYKKALKIFIFIFGENHPHIAGLYSNISNIYLKQGNLSIAFQYKKKSLQIKQTLNSL